MTSTSKKEINYYLPLSGQDIKVYSFFIIMMIVAIIGAFIFKFVEYDVASNLTIKWFLMPSITLAILYAYYSAVRRNSNNNIFRKIFLFTCLTIVFSVMFIKSFESALIIYNGYVGQQKEIQIIGVINDIRIPKREGILSTYKTYISYDSNKTMTLDVIGQKFKVGERFNETMKIGSLGLMYKK